MAYNKQCVVCNKEFIAKVDHKIACSTECRKIHTKQYNRKLYIEKYGEFSGLCLNCNSKIKDKANSARYCSKTCENKLKWKNAEFKCICEYCSKEFIAKESDYKCCSIECRSAFISKKFKHGDVELICKWCSNTFLVEYSNRDRLTCSHSCATRFSNSNRDSEAVSKKISDTLIKGYADGSIIHGFIGKTHSDETKSKIKETREVLGLNKSENNPMFGKKHSKKSRESMSKTKTECILNGKYAGWFSKGRHFSTKLQVEIYHQSSWEKSFFELLDKDILVETYKVQPFSICYYYLTYKRHYIPDILVTFTDGKQKLVEIKPSAFLDAEINKAKFAAAREYCKERNIIFEVWTEKESPYLSKNI